MIIVQPKNRLSSYLNGLLSAGQAVFLRDDALKTLRVGHGAFLDAARRLQKQGFLFSQTSCIDLLRSEPIRRASQSVSAKSAASHELTDHLSDNFTPLQSTSHQV